jgi:hypothetical protein
MESGQIRAVGTGELNMKARLTQDERRAIARRVFAALCALYPDSYIALVEQPGAPTGLPRPEQTTAKAAAAPD